METSEFEKQLQGQKLKNQALSERIGELTSSYENRIAELRVELTIISQENALLREENESFKNVEVSSESNSK